MVSSRETCVDALPHNDTTLRCQQAVRRVGATNFMARRRRNYDDSDLIEQIVMLGGLVILLSFLSPQVRNYASASVVIAVLILLIVLAIGVGYLFIKTFQNERTSWTDIERTKIQYFTSPPPTSTRTIKNGDPPNSAPHRVNIDYTLPRQVSTSSLSDQLRKIDWFQFEKLVALVYEKQGYQVTRRGGANPDGGIDLTILKDGQTPGHSMQAVEDLECGGKSRQGVLGCIDRCQDSAWRLHHADWLYWGR